MEGGQEQAGEEDGEEPNSQGKKKQEVRGGGEKPNSQGPKEQDVQKEGQKAKALEVQVQGKTKGQQQPQHFRRYCCAASGWFDEEG